MYKSLFALTLVCTSISSFANPDLSRKFPFVDIQAQVLDTSTGKPTWQRLPPYSLCAIPNGTT